ncbi:MAG TPA: hypothetical protein VGW40_02145 [Allosphingosinicella sp.]|nr:hypothetical protein [Allosphingosinicella sp.]
MGFRISWLAAQGLSKSQLLAHFGLVDTLVADAANEAPFSAAELPSGWTLLWSNDPAFATIARCTRLSRLAPVLSCWVNETAMFSSANYFEGGVYRWFAGHALDQGADHLVHEGDMPPQFDGIRARLTASQAEYGERQPPVDFLFDIPVELAQSICGFRHDEYHESMHGFTEAVPAPEKPKGLLGRLFGGGR